MQADAILKEHLLKTITLTDEEFDYIYKHFKRLAFKKREVLISGGDPVVCE